MKFVKKPIVARVTFAERDTTIQTLEGPVKCEQGDAILTGAQGEVWPVARTCFERSYSPRAPTRMGEDGMYQKLPLVVQAFQAKADTDVPLRGGKGVLHAHTGDWIVTGPDGAEWVVDIAIFAETYYAVA